MKPFILSFAVVLIGLAGPAVAAEPAKVTITMSDLDCPSCAKKVTTKLVEVPGVAKVETNHETGISVVTIKANTAVSPKALWEAVEKAKKTPVKLEGPTGTFTAKPRA